MGIMSPENAFSQSWTSISMLKSTDKFFHQGDSQQWNEKQSNSIEWVLSINCLYVFIW